MSSKGTSVSLSDARAVPGRRLGKVLALDGLRALAVSLVLVVHTTHLLIPSAARTVLPGGFLGVDLFFVLSGFLITSLLLNEESALGRIRFGAFWRRRGLRLLPALFALVAVHVVYARYTGIGMSSEWSKVRYILTYTVNWRRRLDGGEGLGHLWSLAVEEQFYIIWPLLLMALLLLARRRLSVVASVLALGILLTAAHRAELWHDGEVWLWLVMRTDARADSLLVGALLACLWTGGVSFPRRFVQPLLWIALAFLGWCFLSLHEEGAFLYLGGFTLVALATAVVIYAVLENIGPLGQILSVRPLVVLGGVSYGVYLWHLPAFTVVQRYGIGWPIAARVGIAYVLTAALTVLSWFLVERPFLRLKSRLERPREEVFGPAVVTGAAGACDGRVA